MRTIALPDENATRALGEALAAAMPRSAVLYLEGDLGAGKTTLARALIQRLIPGARVKSPTYALVESYDTPRGMLHHLDLYRIADPGELDFLGLDDPEASWIVEWPERGGDRLPAPFLHLTLEHAPSGRRARLESHSGEGADWMAQVV